MVNALTLALPTDFAYVALVGTGAFWLNLWQMEMVSGYRKKVC